MKKIALVIAGFVILAAAVAGVLAFRNRSPEVARRETPAAGADTRQAAPSTVQIAATSDLLRSQFDPGWISFAVRNPEDKPVEIDTIEINGERLTEDFQLGIQFLWHHLSSKSIPPQGATFFEGQLQGRLDKPVELTVALTDGRKLTARVVPVPEERAVRLMGAFFDAKLERLFLYLRNDASGPVEVDDVDAPGPELAEVDCAARRIEPNRTVPIIVTFKSPRSWGDRVPLLIRLKNGGEVSAGMLRAFSCFPVAMEADFNQAFSSDSPVKVSSKAAQELGLAKLDPVGKRFLFLPNCPMHTFGSRPRAAQEALARTAEAGKGGGKPVTVIHLCRRKHAQAYALFGGIADVIKTNTSVVTEYYDPRRDPEPSPVEWNAKLCFRTLAPVPYYAVIPVFNEIPVSTTHLQTTETDVILSVLGSLVHGAHGVLYRKGKADSLRGGCEKLRGLNEILQGLSGDLAVSCPVQWGTCNQPKAQVGTLLAGKAKLIVTLLNYNRSGKTPAAEVPQACSPLKRVEVALRLPDWFRPGQLVDVASGETIQQRTKSDQEIAFSAGQLDIYRIFRLEAAAGPARAEKDDKGK